MTFQTPSSSSDSLPWRHPVIQRILTNRKISENEFDDFFSWELKKLPELLALKDIDRASERIILALELEEGIGIFGDYDVDGTTSCALFYQFFKLLGKEVDIFQPSRFVEGYGLHKSSIDLALEKGVQLLLTVDCGITSGEAAEYALTQGVDLIITDHHKDVGENLPPALAVVNPNRRDEDPQSPLGRLAGVGVAFAVCLKVKRDLEARGRTCPSLYGLLQYVAVGTVSDLVPLNTMNLKLVRHGLHQIKNTTFPGLAAFFTEEERKRPYVSSEKISFFIGPLINSKGRLDHPERALQLLIAEKGEEATQHFLHLEKCNKERKYIQAQVYEEAKNQVLSNMRGDEPLINVLYQKDWHEGVIGIVASKLVENFSVPAIIFTDAEEKGIIKGSARTAGDLDIFQCLNENIDLFKKFGGHKAAAGLSMPKENFNILRNRLKEKLRLIPRIQRTTLPFFDSLLSIHEIDLPLLRALEKMEPFGNGNPRPIFKMRDVRVESFQILKDVHVRWNFSALRPGPGGVSKSLRGISFNYVGSWGRMHPSEIMKEKGGEGPTVQFSLQSNFYKGSESIQLMVEEISF